MRAFAVVGLALQADGQRGGQRDRGEGAGGRVAEAFGVVVGQLHIAELVGEQVHVGGEVNAGVQQRGERTGAVRELDGHVVQCANSGALSPGDSPNRPDPAASSEATDRDQVT
ncbi:hypothetical protein ABT061_25225 [Streptosporangium sp. NPDC002544]|uniref:hypothetical protein n=1 Tax=Streptosporangium sp. NPDC002544 TaxID=3154538 RepID=UPI00332235F7